MNDISMRKKLSIALLSFGAASAGAVWGGEALYSSIKDSQTGVEVFDEMYTATTSILNGGKLAELGETYPLYSRYFTDCVSQDVQNALQQSEKVMERQNIGLCFWDKLNRDRAEFVENKFNTVAGVFGISFVGMVGAVFYMHETVRRREPEPTADI